MAQFVRVQARVYFEIEVNAQNLRVFEKWLNNQQIVDISLIEDYVSGSWGYDILSVTPLNSDETSTHLEEGEDVSSL